jgi:elongation factor 2
MCGIRFNVLDVTVSPLHTYFYCILCEVVSCALMLSNVGGQIIPTCHCVCYAAFLLATPGLQEPVHLSTFCSPRNFTGC